MPAFWIEFNDRRPGCVEADTDTAALVAARLITKKHPTKAYPLPYPANPRLNHEKRKDMNGREYTIPSFCYQPLKCKKLGGGYCHQSPSCTE